MRFNIFEGMVEAGKIILRPDVRLENGNRVYVVVPEGTPTTPFRIISPRIADMRQITDFVIEYVKDDATE